jgi:ligand-binding SRPBCC domain-containing protein
MATFILKTVQKIPTDLEKAWSFFSDAANLQAITPQNLSFTILSDQHDAKMYPGQIIEYKIKPVLGIPIYWMTEITHVQEKVFFVDEQRFGPYQLWHHQHLFNTVAGGIEMTDIVHYRNSFGFLGNIANHLFVENELRRIFEFRFRKIQDLFGVWDGEINSLEFVKSVGKKR